MQGILELTGLVISFAGAVILAFVTYIHTLPVLLGGTLPYKLRGPKVVVITGLAVLPIGFALQCWAALLS